MIDRLRRRAGALVVDGFFNGVSRLGKLHPRSRPDAHGVEVIADVSYLPTGRRDHLLDVYRPRGVHAHGPLRPVVLYVHGGGFRILSKDTHWVMGLAFARRGYVVFSANYRLSSEAPFPAAVEDVCEAYRWVAEHAARYGGDASQLVLAGESAGANLVTALTVAACFRREEPYARAVWDTGVVPRAVLPACGLLQVTDPGRFRRRRPDLSAFLQDRIDEVSRSYLRDHGLVPGAAPELDLADPLLVLERDTPAERPLPPFFVPCGTADPLLHDSRRLAAALGSRGAPVEAAYYPGEIHAFHAFVFRPEARRCWADTYRFLDAHVPIPG